MSDMLQNCPILKPTKSPRIPRRLIPLMNLTKTQPHFITALLLGGHFSVDQQMSKELDVTSSNNIIM